MEHATHRAKRSLGFEGIIRYETRDAITGALIPEESGVVHNVVTDDGLEQIAKILAQMAYSTGYEIAVGAGTTEPDETDTELEDEVFRDEVTSQTAAGALFTTKVFMDTGDGNGETLSEVGLFFDEVNIDHALLSPTIAKTSAKTVTIQIDIIVARPA